MACLETVVNHGILYVLRIAYPDMVTEIDGSRLGRKIGADSLDRRLLPITNQVSQQG